MEKEVLEALLDKLLYGEDVSAEEIVELTFFVGSEASNPKQRILIVLLLGLKYLEGSKQKTE